MRRVALALLLLHTSTVLAEAPDAPAASRLRPTSDDLSLLSGRTLGNGEVALAGALGWPGFWVEVMFAPNSRFNIGVRGHVDYGAQLGTSAGFGGGLSVPMRRLLYAQGNIDLALHVQPFVGFGEGSYVGQKGVFSDDFGWTVSLTAGARAGFRLGRITTLIAGAEGLFGVLATPEAEATDVYGAFAAIAGAELQMSRATVLFVELRAGYGVRPDLLFKGGAFLRGSIGFAYRL